MNDKITEERGGGRLTTVPSQKKRHSDILKVIAILTMLIDHIGFVLFPDTQELRMIGRLAFPIFAFQLAVGYRHTSNKRKYMSRLWVFALISQIPYMLLFDTSNLNILFTLLLSIFVMDQLEKKRWYVFPQALILVIILQVSPSIPNFEYGWYGLLTPILFYWFYHSKEKSLFAQELLTIAYLPIGNPAWYQVFALIGVLICLYLPQDKFKVYLNKYFFYWFYPIHLLLIFIVIQLLR